MLGLITKGIKKIPVWVKSPLLLVLKEFGKIPLALIVQHVRCCYVECRNEEFEAICKANQEKQRITSQYLCKKYGEFLKKQSGRYTCGEKEDNFPVWIFWWQGEENAPEIIRRCIASIRRNAAGHPVHVVTQSNFESYVQLPDYILEKMASKRISLTHFSDILRMNLIADHGGFWLDATIFCNRLITGSDFDRPIFTGRNPNGDPMNVSRWEWTGFAIYGWKNNALFCLTRDLFNQYWKDHDRLVDYFLIDYFIRLICDYVPMVVELINAVPINNTDIYYFQHHFNDPYDGSDYHKVLLEDTWLYKLTWKMEYAAQTEKGEPTVFAQWCQDHDWR